MDTLELSLMSYDAFTAGLSDLLAEFEARYHVHVHVTLLSWENAWTQVVKYALYGDVPAVSEVGSTWVASLATMNALRPFTSQEVTALGGESAFLAAAWQSGMLQHDPTLWAIPWLAETRVIFYRRDLLEKAGVDESTAFHTPDRLVDTLKRLQAAGVANPWCVPTQPTITTFHNVASWVWGAGGDFVDHEQRRVLFDQDAARAGLRSYYELQRFLPPTQRALDAYTSDDLFFAGQAAATLSGPWLLVASDAPLDPQLATRIGVALPPGDPLVSESHLVIWKSISPRLERLGVELVRFLTGRKSQLKCSRQVGLLPVRNEVLCAPPFSIEPSYQMLSRGLQTGRSFPAMRLWGLIEDRLVPALGNLWQKVLAVPTPAIDTIIRTELEPLAQRLNRTLNMSQHR